MWVAGHYNFSVVVVKNMLALRLCVKTHAGDTHNDQVDSMSTAVIKANNIETLFEGLTKITTFPLQNSFTAPRKDLNTNARYQTLPLYAIRHTPPHC